MSDKGKKTSGRGKEAQKGAKKPYVQVAEMIVGGIIILTVLAVVITQMLPRFTVKKILFEGNFMVDEEEILDVAEIRKEDAIFRLDLEDIARRVEEMPYIKHCKVIRSYPEQVLIRVIERTAFACVLMHNRLFEIDRECYILRELTPFSLHTGPLITNLPTLTVGTPGTQIVSPELSEALSLWDIYIRMPMSEKLTLSELSAESPSLLRMFFEELPYEIRWGRSDFEEQATRLNILWDDRQGELPCDCYLDLRFDADLVCK
ncbi:MAG: FtsQ-type POTRA domain-containing protein [Candidatus Hydrogenedens sp.]|jgi:hypothetical protein|nr:FtsQ-type POTRA domain-containing protein [Candidatus Hydrogenedens sp.]